jgi:hypothetical protein
MSTVTHKKIVDEIIANNGNYSSDPPVHSIVEYRSAFGGVCWGLNYSNHNAYTPSEYVLEPKVIFTREEK